MENTCIGHSCRREGMISMGHFEKTFKILMIKSDCGKCRSGSAFSSHDMRRRDNSGRMILVSSPLMFPMFLPTFIFSVALLLTENTKSLFLLSARSTTTLFHYLHLSPLALVEGDGDQVMAARPVDSSSPISKSSSRERCESRETTALRESRSGLVRIWLLANE